MYSSILPPSLHVLLEIDSAEWLYGESASRDCFATSGYRILVDATDSLKCVECVDENHTISAYYHEKLRSSARGGVISEVKKL